jgi:hypothetical protein
MIADVVGQRHIPLDEVRAWEWDRLRKTHRQVLRLRWDQHLSGIREVEMGVVRGIAPMFSKKKLPDLPSFEKVADKDAFDPGIVSPSKPETGSGWDKYLEANKLER